MMVSSFVPQRHLNHLVASSSSTTTTSLYFFDAFSAPKDDGTPGDYVCKVKIVVGSTTCFDFLVSLTSIPQL